MPARRFFVEGVREPGACVAIDGSDARKITRVLRLGDGDAIEIVDSAGTLFAATVSIDGSRVRAALGTTLTSDETGDATLHIDVAQAVPKGPKMDFIVEKATELGAAAILPFYSERTIVSDAGDAKLERWRRVAKAASQQCGRRTLPRIDAALPSFGALLCAFAAYDVVFFPWELAPPTPLRDRLPELLAGARRALIVVGPEGGFTHAEAESARERGAAVVWLGPRILRTETAAMVLLAVIDAFVQRA